MVLKGSLQPIRWKQCNLVSSLQSKCKESSSLSPCLSFSPFVFFYLTNTLSTCFEARSWYGVIFHQEKGFNWKQNKRSYFDQWVQQTRIETLQEACAGLNKASLRASSLCGGKIIQYLTLLALWKGDLIRQWKTILDIIWNLNQAYFKRTICWAGFIGYSDTLF